MLRPMSTTPTYRRSAPAKLNLTLRILGTRPDGFHELESLVTRIDLCDTLEVVPQEDGRYQFECDDPTLPADGTNLVLRAARALARHGATNHGADFRLYKRIPAGAGLGGGSSDAAATLLLLNEAWGLECPQADLIELGAKLGSDVPLFFHGPRCLVRGRGEIIDEVAVPLHGWVTLLLPPLCCATPTVYRAWDSLATSTAHPTADRVLAALRTAGGSAADLMPLLFNDLTPAAYAAYPELEQWAVRAAETAGGPVGMSGSGAALFRLYDTEHEAREFAERAAANLGVRTETAALAMI